jgi:hypothetical protein
LPWQLQGELHANKVVASDGASLTMAPPNPRADWERLGDSFYRKVRIYDGVFDEDLELENYVVAAAPNAGALGTISPPVFGTVSN